LATNLTSKRAALRAYRRRPWVKEMSGDLNKHGFDLESTHPRHFLRLSRLTFAVALLYVWLVTCRAHAIKNGQRDLVDRKDPRDLCIFQMEWRITKRRLLDALPVSINLCPRVW